LGRHLAPTVKCEVCFERFKALSRHTRRHGLTIKQYKLAYPGAEVVSPLTKRKQQLARLKYILKKTGKLNTKTSSGLKPTDLRLIGHPHSEATKEKIRQSRLGKALSEEHKLAISAALMGHSVSHETRLKLRAVVVSEEGRRRRSEAQSAEKGNSWKGGRSRHLYQSKGKYRLKRIFGAPLKCFFPGCDLVEGENARFVDCHHIDGDHENNPLDGMNWLPLCRRHHMLADGRLGGATPEEAEEARKLAVKAHTEHMKKNYVGDIRTYSD